MVSIVAIARDKMGVVGMRNEEEKEETEDCKMRKKQEKKKGWV